MRRKVCLAVGAKAFLYSFCFYFVFFSWGGKKKNNIIKLSLLFARMNIKISNKRG